MGIKLRGLPSRMVVRYEKMHIQYGRQQIDGLSKYFSQPLQYGSQMTGGLD